jgi:hypothetical protein
VNAVVKLRVGQLARVVCDGLREPPVCSDENRSSCTDLRSIALQENVLTRDGVLNALETGQRGSEVDRGQIRRSEVLLTNHCKFAIFFELLLDLFESKLTRSGPVPVSVPTHGLKGSEHRSKRRQEARKPFDTADESL